MGTSGKERRQFGRRESCIHAHVIAPGRGLIPCFVLNLSEEGALVHLVEPIPTIQTLRLVIESAGLDVACTVRHRGLHGIGLRFATAAETALVDQLSGPAKAVRPTTILELRRALFGQTEQRAT